MNLSRKSLLLILFSIFSISSYSQQYNFTKQDTLRGSITPERAWWDLVYYHLDISVKPDEKFIEGSNTITVSYTHLTLPTKA